MYIGCSKIKFFRLFLARLIAYNREIENLIHLLFWYLLRSRYTRNTDTRERKYCVEFREFADLLHRSSLPKSTWPTTSIGKVHVHSPHPLCKGMGVAALECFSRFILRCMVHDAFCLCRTCQSPIFVVPILFD